MVRRLLAILVLIGLTAAPVLASPQAALAAALDDARALPKSVACQTRYLDASNIPAGDRPELFAVLCGWVHHLSREADIVRPRAVREDLYAIRLDAYGWLAKTWDAMRVEPYFHQHSSDGGYRYHWAGFWLDPVKARELEARLGTRTPIVRADYFLFYSSRQLDLRNRNDHGFGYLDWLQLRKRADVDELAALEKRKAIQLGRELRAVIEQGRSGVVQLDRQIEWFATYGDDEFGYWITLDTVDNSGGNTGPGNLQAGTFRHQAEEIVFGLPSGHVGMWLGNQKGVKQDTAPDTLGGNDTPLRIGRDTRIHVGQCFHCHTNGFLKDVDDWARETIRAPNQLDDKDYRNFVRLKRQYMRSLETKIEQGRAKYERALQESCGLTSGEFARLHSRAYYRYQFEPRTPAVLAVELGCTEEQLTTAVKRALDTKNLRLKAEERQRLTPLLPLTRKDPRPIPVTSVEQFYQDLQCILKEYGP